MKRKVNLSDSDLLAMYRNFIFTKMGVTNDDKRPTDKECLDWLQAVMAQAEHRIDAPLLMRVYPDVECAPIAGSGGKHSPDIRPILRRFDIACGLPEWRAPREPRTPDEETKP
jgi:hypothetical protein